MGKSRIASTLIYLCSLLDKITRIHYYYSHPKLQNVDELALRALRETLANVDVQTSCIEDSDTTVRHDDNTLVILDEADNIIVDKGTTFDARNVVGLTATAEDDKIFTQALKHGSWAVQDSKIDCDLSYNSIASLDAFLKAT